MLKKGREHAPDVAAENGPQLVGVVSRAQQRRGQPGQAAGIERRGDMTVKIGSEADVVDTGDVDRVVNGAQDSLEIAAADRAGPVADRSR